MGGSVEKDEFEDSADFYTVVNQVVEEEETEQQKNLEAIKEEELTVNPDQRVLRRPRTPTHAEWDA